MTFVRLFKKHVINRPDRRRVLLQLLLCLPILPVLILGVVLVPVVLLVPIFDPKGGLGGNPRDVASSLITLWAYLAFCASIFVSDETCRAHRNRRALLLGGLALTWAVASRTMYGSILQVIYSPDAADAGALFSLAYWLVSLSSVLVVTAWNDLRIHRARPFEAKSRIAPTLSPFRVRM
jgi:hypothetical protein